jgi:hypothetical protein
MFTAGELVDMKDSYSYSNGDWNSLESEKSSVPY